MGQRPSQKLNEQTEGCDQARLKMGEEKSKPLSKKHKLSEDKQITE